ncbi:MAG: hypothetical protein NT154_20155 [Verrucomicrobia bacterium]|nr:hypothetical protein [Verrucomicrobiota bacterium]
MMYSGMPGSYAARACLAEADSLQGPWRDLGVVIEPSRDPEHFTYGGHDSVGLAQFVSFRGKWHAYYLVRTAKDSRHRPRLQGDDFVAVAVADRPEGPWKMADTPVILKGGRHIGTFIEDHSEFVWKDRVYMVIDDNEGGVSGVRGSVLLFESDDGLTFPFEKARLMVATIPVHCPAFDAQRATCVWTAEFKFEAPRVLLIEGVPACFFGGGGTNVEGEERPTNYCLKIPKWVP